MLFTNGKNPDSFFKFLKEKILNINNRIKVIFDDFEKINFSPLKILMNWLVKLIDRYKTINIKSMEKKINNLNLFYDLFQILKNKINEIYFFKDLEKENKDSKENINFYLLESIINIFDKKINDELDLNIFTRTSFLILNDKEKNNIIKDLFECYILYKIIFFNYEKVIINNYKNNEEFRKLVEEITFVFDKEKDKSDKNEKGIIDEYVEDNKKIILIILK